MIKKLEKCIKRYINDYLEKDWYDEEEFGDKINEIIEVLNKKEEITVTIPKGEYNIWGNNPEIQKDYISKKELKEWIEKEYGTTFYGSIHQVVLNKLIEHFNL